MHEVVRIGRLAYLNALPVYHGLDVPGAEYVDGTPAQLNGLMAAGGLDLSVISAAEFLLHRERYALLPELCLTARGQVKSVLLLSKVPLDALSGCAIALTSSSATSVIMLRAILAQQGIENYSTFSLPPDPSKMLVAGTAFLLIGDDALNYVPPPDLYVYDIGLMWVRMTGTPAVFAVLAAQRDFLASREGQAKEIACRMRSALYRNLGKVSDLPVDVRQFPGLDLERYFELLGYAYDDDAIAGLLALSRYAAGLGIGAELKEIDFAW